MPFPLLREAQETIRAYKARRALYEFLHRAMWEGENCPPPPIMAGMSDEYITERLHKLLGIRKPWWKRLFGG